MTGIIDFGCAGLRAFRKNTNVETAPVTVLFGANNSGKTTLVRLPLFIHHSLLRDELYTLRALTAEFGSSLRDLCTASDPHPSLRYWIRYRDGRQADVKLSVQTRALDETVRRETQFSLDEKRMDIADWRRIPVTAAEPVHIPSARGVFELVYPPREETDLQISRVPQILAHSPDTLEEVRTWVESTFRSHSLDVVRELNSLSLVTDSKATQNLARAGRGLQSAVQIATLVAHAARDGGPRAILIEEPEAHIHPGAHGAIADLIIERAARNQFVIETHSENFLLRLRRRVAEGIIPAHKVALYFIDEEHAANRIAIDDDGMVDNWPTGVFEYDIDEAEAILAARIQAGRN